MMNRNLSRLPSVTLAVVALSYLILLVDIHIQFIRVPVPVDRFEGIMPAITHLIASGHFPYTAATVPVYMDPYPPLYNLLVAPFAMLFGNTFFIHRLIAGVFIGLCCWLYVYVARKKSIPLAYTLTGTALLYAALMFYSTPVASTNSLGLFLFMASVIVPWSKSYTRPSLYASMIIGVLAFYAKQYFVFGPIFVALYLFLFESKLQGFRFGCLFILVLLVSLAVVNYLCPFFIGDVILSQRNVVNLYDTYSYSFYQIWLFIKTYAGLFLIFGVYGITQLLRMWRSNSLLHEVQGFGFDVARLDAPLFNRRIEFFTFCFVCSTVLIAFYLGKNHGNYMTYLFQLMSPFLLLSVFDIFRKKSNALMAVSVPLLLWCFYNSYNLIRKDFNIAKAGWHRVDTVVSGGTNVFTSPVLVMSVLKSGKELYDDGQALMFKFSLRGPWYLQSESTRRSGEEIWKNYRNKLDSMVKNKQFDLLLIDRYTHAPKNYREYYKRTEVIKLNMTNRRGGGPVNVGVWRPK